MAEEAGRQADFAANKSVGGYLVQHMVDTSRLRISCTKGNAHVRGDLVFKGEGVNRYASPDAQAALLAKLERGIMALPHMRSVRMEITGWNKAGKRWNMK